MATHSNHTVCSERADPPLTSAPRLLIADDDAVLRVSLGKIYTKAGYEVVLAADGEEAIQLARTQPFDLALIDLSMPKYNGLEVLKAMKRFAPRMPVIILTAFGAWDTYAEALEAGVYQYVSKPIRQDELLLLARNALESAH
ncbi:MAG: response regulator [Candidatus Latescibacteria bacterium]|nr:response regulator [Candidatus Latescibacterota bacterium]